MVICNNKGGINILNLGFLVIFMGMIYLIYSILRKGKVTVYNRNSRMTILEKEKYLKFKLQVAILNGIVAITWGTIMIIFKADGLYAVLYPLSFHCINGMFHVIIKNKKYVSYKN